MKRMGFPEGISEVDDEVPRGHPAVVFCKLPGVVQRVLEVGPPRRSEEVVNGLVDWHLLTFGILQLGVEVEVAAPEREVQ